MHVCLKRVFLVFSHVYNQCIFLSIDILSRNNKFAGQIADDKVATRMRYDEREVQNGGEKMDNPPPYNWINRRFVARPGSQLLFTRCRYSPRGGTMMYVARDLYLLRGYIKWEERRTKWLMHTILVVENRFDLARIYLKTNRCHLSLPWYFVQVIYTCSLPDCGNQHFLSKLKLFYKTSFEFYFVLVHEYLYDGMRCIRKTLFYIILGFFKIKDSLNFFPAPE